MLVTTIPNAKQKLGQLKRLAQLKQRFRGTQRQGRSQPPFEIESYPPEIAKPPLGTLAENQEEIAKADSDRKKEIDRINRKNYQNAIAYGKQVIRGVKDMQSLRDRLLKVGQKKAERYVDRHITINLDGHPSGDLTQMIRDILVDFYRLTGKEFHKTLEKVVYLGEDAGSSDRLKLINIGDYDSDEEYKASLFHELGHHFEYRCSLEVRGIIEQFYKDKKTRKTKNKDKDFWAEKYLGDFIDPYVGKHYPEDETRDSEQLSKQYYPSGDTEVLSTGFEYFSSPELMEELLQKDDRHFALMIALLAV